MGQVPTIVKASTNPTHGTTNTCPTHVTTTTLGNIRIKRKRSLV
jgi:hypothetical protein